MKKYVDYHVKKAIRVTDLITLETLDISPGFVYPEETHDFYEFAYIDNGSIFCIYEDKKIELRQGHFFLIPPQHRHHYEAVPNRSASIFIVCFRCSTDVLDVLNHRILLTKESRGIVSDLFSEAKNAFVFPFHKKLMLCETPVLGAQQLVENELEKLLIILVRSEMHMNDSVKLVMNSVEMENDLAADLIAILKENIYAKLTLEEICSKTYYSKTFLNNVFKKSVGYSIMQYYAILKMEEAKKLLREGVSASLTASRLNYESATYFTKVFRKYTGMTPSAYKKTLL